MKIRSLGAALAFVGLALIGGASGYGCSSKNSAGTGNNDDGGEQGSSSSGGGFVMGDAAPVVRCAGGVGLQCSVQPCTGQTPTSISGTIFDPAGKNPLYNVQVYVPNAPPVGFASGASCDSCSALYTPPVASAVTDASGHFSITKAPSGPSIPLIVQVGKWRMQYVIPNVTQCTDNNAATLLSTTLRLPKNHMEGDLPNMAISTGIADSLECLLRRMGVDASEYVPGAGTPGQGNIHIFTGGAPGYQGAETSPQSPQSYSNLFDTAADLDLYDLVLFSCEGASTAYMGSAAQNNLWEYVNNGGRVFASHYHFAWFQPSTAGSANPFSTTMPALATWTNTTASNTVGMGDILNDSMSFQGDVSTTLPDGTTPFPEGVALKAWLGNVGALDSAGKLDVWYARHNANLSPTNSLSQPWISLDPSVTQAPGAAQYFSFDTPIGTAAAEQCGRVVYSDLHVSGGPGVTEPPGTLPDYAAGGGIDIVPDQCAIRALTPQEKALEFMIFDLSACLIPPGQPTQSNMQPQ
jgi:hypothetical protein